MEKPPFNSRFEVKARLFKPSSEVLNEAKASLSSLKTIFPSCVDPETDPDILYIVGNLAVAGVLNLNDDGLSIEESIAVYKKFEKKPVNLEHDRKQNVGFILKAGLSELGTDKPILEDEAKTSNKPFNISVVIVLWKVVAKDLCDYILKNSDDNGNKELSLSFEVGFDAYQIIELSGDSLDFTTAKKIVFAGCDEFKVYDAALRVNGGSGKKNGNKIGRSLSGEVVPLGAGVVTIPAAAVKGIAPVTEAIPESESIREHAKAININDKKMKTIRLPNKLFGEWAELKETLTSDKAIFAYVMIGEKMNLIHVNDKGELESHNDSDFLDKDIISLDTFQVVDHTGVESSPIIYPNINKRYPAEDSRTREKDALYEKQRAELRKKDYKDASGKLIEIFEKLIQLSIANDLNKNTIKNGVLESTSNNNIMNFLEKLNEAKAKVATTEDPAVLKETFAHMGDFFAAEIAKKSEELVAHDKKHKEIVDDAMKAKEDAQKTHDSVKKELEALRAKLKEMDDAHAAAEAERKFNARMEKLSAEYDMDEGCMAYVANKIKAMDDGAYADYENEAKIVMKEKSKAYKAELHEKMKAATASTVQVDPKVAIASAVANPVNPPILNSLEDMTKSMKEKMKEAFGTDVSVGGKTLKKLADEKAAKDIENK